MFNFVRAVMAQFQMYSLMLVLCTNYVTRPFNDNKKVLLFEFLRQLTR